MSTVEKTVYISEFLFYLFIRFRERRREREKELEINCVFKGFIHNIDNPVQQTR